MRRLFRSRPLAVAILALPLLLVGGQACAMAPSGAGHEHGATHVAAAMTEVPADDASHVHHHAAGVPAGEDASRPGVAPEHERSGDGHDQARCAAAVSCGVAPLTSGAAPPPELSIPIDPLAGSAALELRSTRPEPDSPPPRR